MKVVILHKIISEIGSFNLLIHEDKLVSQFCFYNSETSIFNAIKRGMFLSGLMNKCNEKKIRITYRNIDDIEKVIKIFNMVFKTTHTYDKQVIEDYFNNKTDVSELKSYYLTNI